MAKAFKVYGYKGCSTCRKAYAFLKKKGVTFDEVDITETPPSRAELSKLLAAVDGNLRKLFNTSGQVYREQKIGPKLETMTTAAALSLLAGNGRLIKRPVLVIGGHPVAVGFDEKVWSQKLG